jgi:hypothetical protein
MSVDPETVEDWKNYWLLQEIQCYDLCDIYNTDQIGPFFNLQLRKIFTFWGDFCCDNIKSKTAGYCNPHVQCW